MTRTSTIGSSSRDYATPALWIASLVTIGTLTEQEIGDCYNDSEFTVTTAISFTGFVPASGKEAILKAASGQGFADHANAQTNAPRYNQSNGVGIRTTTSYIQVISMTLDYIIIRGLQIKNDGTGNSDGTTYNNETGATHSEVSRCILETTSNSNPFIARMRTGIFVSNICVMHRSAGGSGVTVDYAGTLVVIGNTVVRPSDKTAAGSGFHAFSGTTTLTNNAIFGFTNSVSNTSRFAGTNNCSDVTLGFGSSQFESKTYANQFVNTAAATLDLRIKDTSADLYNNGATSATYDATDIVNTARPQGVAYDIGAWELVVASGNLFMFSQLNGLGSGGPFFNNRLG